jgi:hypothetical protein
MQPFRVAFENYRHLRHNKVARANNVHRVWHRQPFFFIFSHSPLNFTLAPFKKSYLPLQSISPSHVIHVFFIIIFILKEPWNYKYFSISSFLIFNLSDLIIVLFITVFNFSMSYKSTIWSSFFYCCLFFLGKFLKLFLFSWFHHSKLN